MLGGASISMEGGDGSRDKVGGDANTKSGSDGLAGIDGGDAILGEYGGTGDAPGIGTEGGSVC